MLGKSLSEYLCFSLKQKEVENSRWLFSVCKMQREVIYDLNRDKYNKQSALGSAQFCAYFLTFFVGFKKSHGQN